jgi:bifunctional N-acetylglucosamine-1-phosphate-uridyltransferase/glucosamine-1-phosphate-acetyltransferase GlmU-like protein
LKAVILAAGKEAITADGEPLVLQTLGERSILQCVVENALQVVRAEDIYVVVGYRQEDVRCAPGTEVQLCRAARGAGHRTRDVAGIERCSRIFPAIC